MTSLEDTGRGRWAAPSRVFVLCDGSRGAHPDNRQARQRLDHGRTTVGLWQNKSPHPVGQAPRLVIEWTAVL